MPGGREKTISQSFEYFAPTSIREAVDLLKKHGSEGRCLAGGQSLVPILNLGLASPRYIIDLNRVRELNFITDDKSHLTIGAMTTHFTLETSEAVREFCPALADAAAHVGDVQVRHRGTLGGSVCHADPAGDYAPVLVAVDAELEVVSVRSKRTINSRHFFKDVFTTALEPDELLTSVRIPKPASRSGSAYQKLEFITGGFAIVGAAALVGLENSGTCRNLSMAVGGVESIPLWLSDAEREIKGKKIDEEALRRTGEIAVSTVRNPLSDIHAEGEYRKDMAGVLAKRALKAALSRAK